MIFLFFFLLLSSDFFCILPMYLGCTFALMIFDYLEKKKKKIF
jgi:hypothetical protein